jgi:4-amino-4-deoxy-L-arabinose transferase-like glycosyltransferase
MLTYSSNASIRPVTTEKPWLLMLLGFVWLWPGILFRDPWRPNEPHVTAILAQMQHSGEILNTYLLDQFQASGPPLFYWVSIFFVRGLSPWLLDFDDAARIATPFLMAISIALIGGAGRELLGHRHGRSVALIVLGSMGLMLQGHRLDNGVALWMSLSGVFYALCLRRRLAALGGALLGFFLTLTFFASSIVMVIALTVLIVCLSLLPAYHNRTQPYPLLKSRSWLSRAVSTGMAVLISVPVMVLWPFLLHQYYPAAFQYWWSHDAFPVEMSHFSFENFWRTGFYVVKNLAWAAFPAWPLAFFTLTRPKALHRPVVQFSLYFFVGYFVILFLLGHKNGDHFLPLVLPLSVLAAMELDQLRRNYAAFLNWFGLMGFGVLGLLLWLGWLAMNLGWPAQLAARSLYFSPYYVPRINVLAILFALFSSTVWVWAVTRPHLRGRQVVTNWAAGVTLIWCLLMSLWLPWFDAAKSYRPVVSRMMQALPAGETVCLSNEPQLQFARLTWRYYAQFEFQPSSPACRWQLIVKSQAINYSPELWESVWEGARPRERSEIYVLLKKRDE